MAFTAFTIVAGAGLRASVPALVATSGPFAKFILLVLLAVSIYSWAIIAERLLLYVRAARQDRAFLALFRGAPPGSDLRLVSQQHPASVLARVAQAGHRALEQMPAAEAMPYAQRYELAQRAMEREIGDQQTRLEAHVGFLATTGSVSPFIGLMGTVWGVMTAFLNIGAQGSASLVVVAPGIAEALITTVAGLAAAIPAVVGYNHLLGRLRLLTNTSGAFVTEYLDRRLGRGTP